MENVLKWNSPFIASMVDGSTDLILKGVLIDTTINKNGWSIQKSDFKQLANQFINRQIRVDHGEQVKDVLGTIISTEVDEGHSEAKADWDPANLEEHIHYVAQLSSADQGILVPILKRYVGFVSPGVDAYTMLCSTCKVPMISKDQKNCKCKEHGIILKNFQARELSIVATPAYTNTVMIPFAASVDEQFNSSVTGGNNDTCINKTKEVTMEDNARMTALEAAVSTLIAKFTAAEKSAEKKEEEEEKKEKVEESEEESEEESKKKKVPVEEKATSEKEDYKSTPAFIEHDKKNIETVKKKQEEMKKDAPVEEKKAAVAGKAFGASASFSGSVGQKQSLKQLEEQAMREMFSLAANMGIVSYK